MLIMLFPLFPYLILQVQSYNLTSGWHNLNLVSRLEDDTTQSVVRGWSQWVQFLHDSIAIAIFNQSFSVSHRWIKMPEFRTEPGCHTTKKSLHFELILINTANLTQLQRWRILIERTYYQWLYNLPADRWNHGQLLLRDGNTCSWIKPSVTGFVWAELSCHTPNFEHVNLILVGASHWSHGHAIAKAKQ